MPGYLTLEEMIAAGGIDGVILATPNRLHEAGALACIDAGLPVLVEKPIATDLPDLAGFFARHDLQIGAGGGATWERCCMGVPSVLVVAADNQNVVVPQLAARGIAAAGAP